MHRIRIPQEHWGQVWGTLVASGPITRISKDPIYIISDKQLQLLRRKKLPFELLPPQNGRPARVHHG
ncbi:MAG TPA: hypothetical protein VGZ47_17720 [Gemmataceae bacterium]|nr:hypothetical protein [Gemmataceae bacterium]